MSSVFGINIAEAEKDLHPVFKTDPNQLWKYVNQKVTLSTCEGLVYEGYVYTIDPVTHNWVLFARTDGTTGCKLIIVMHSSVTNIEVSDEECPAFISRLMTEYGNVKQVDLDPKLIADRKDAVCRWFGVNRIPVTKLINSISVANGAVTIEPPYLPENCFSSNEIILSKVRTLLNALPKDDNMQID